MYDTKVRILNVFRMNTFEADDVPVPRRYIDHLAGSVSGTEAPPGPRHRVDGLQFASLLENFSIQYAAG